MERCQGIAITEHGAGGAATAQAGSALHVAGTADRDVLISGAGADAGGADIEVGKTVIEQGVIAGGAGLGHSIDGGAGVDSAIAAGRDRRVTDALGQQTGAGSGIAAHVAAESVKHAIGKGRDRRAGAREQGHQAASGKTTAINGVELGQVEGRRIGQGDACLTATGKSGGLGRQDHTQAPASDGSQGGNGVGGTW